MRILKTEDASAGLQAMYLLQIFAQAQQHQNDFQLTTLLEHLGCDTPAEASVTIKDYFYKHIRRVCRCEYDRCLRWKKTALPKGVSGRGGGSQRCRGHKMHCSILSRILVIIFTSFSFFLKSY